VSIIRADTLNVVDVLNADTVLITQPSITTMSEVYA
jgi:ribosomal protein L4